MAQLDRRGLPLSTNSDLSAECYREGVELLIAAWPGAADQLKQAAKADPDFALPIAALARMHAMRAEPAEARALIASAGEIVARRGTERERNHVEILSLAINGQSKMALERTLAHLETWPRDTLIFTLPLGVFGLYAFSGMKDHDQARVDLLERHARHYDTDDWWFQSHLGWSYAENGNTKIGRDLTERGFELRRNSGQSAHALMHALFECGAGEATDKLIAGWLPTYGRSGQLHGHVAWHWALVALERGDLDRALEIYRDHIQPSVSVGLPINIVTDTSSFLWRVQAYGHQVPAGLWEDAAAYASPAFPAAGFPFADIHMAMLAAATGDRQALEQRIQSLTTLLDAGKLSAGPVVPAICRAILAFADADYAQCVRLLEPVADEVVRIGSSNTQREVVEDTLLVAFMRAHEAEKARALLDKRLHRRPSPRDAQWRDQLAA
jgi:hypothetical protein